MIGEAQIENIFSRFQELNSQRIQIEDTWDDIISYTNPNMGYVQQEDTKGSIRTAHIFDNTADIDLKRLSASLNSMLTSQFSAWLELTTDNEELNEEQVMKEWLEDISKLVLDSYRDSNFYGEIDRFYYDLSCIGTAIMYVEKDDSEETYVRFSTRHIRECYIAEDKYGEIDTVFRKVKMTLRQVVQRWGLDKVSKRTSETYIKEPDKEINILHCVHPRADFDKTKKKSTDLPFASYWFEFEEKHLLSESGYEELPYIIARWFVQSTEIYGRGPMHIALPNVITLNRLMELYLLTGELAIKPPLKADKAIFDYKDEVNLSPGSVTVMDSPGSFEPIWDTTRSVIVSDKMIERVTLQVDDMLLGNQLQVIDRNNMTAEEVRARISENAKIIGPTFGRFQSEFLDRLITRTISILGIGKVIPPPPIQEPGALTVKFISPLAKAQRTDQIQGIFSTLQWIKEAAEINPAVVDNVDFDKATAIISDVNNTPAEIIRDEKQVEQIRQQRAQQQQQAQQVEMQMAQVQAQEAQSKSNKNNAEASAKIKETEGE